jgi:hypothetical protein
MTDMKLVPEPPLRREDRRVPPTASPRQIGLAHSRQRGTATRAEATDLVALETPALWRKTSARHVTCATIAVIQPVPTDTKVLHEYRRQHAMDDEAFPSIGIAVGVSTLAGIDTAIELVRAARDLPTGNCGPTADVLAVGWVALRAGGRRHTHRAGSGLAHKPPGVNRPLGTVATVTSMEDCS